MSHPCKGRRRSHHGWSRSGRFRQRGQSPPQSTSVSLPFFAPSLQVGEAHRPPWQIPPGHAVPSGSFFLHLPCLRFLQGGHGFFFRTRSRPGPPHQDAAHHRSHSPRRAAIRQERAGPGYRTAQASIAPSVSDERDRGRIIPPSRRISPLLDSFGALFGPMLIARYQLCLADLIVSRGLASAARDALSCGERAAMALALPSEPQSTITLDHRRALTVQHDSRAWHATAT